MIRGEAISAAKVKARRGTLQLDCRQGSLELCTKAWKAFATESPPSEEWSAAPGWARDWACRVLQKKGYFLLGDVTGLEPPEVPLWARGTFFQRRQKSLRRGYPCQNWLISPQRLGEPGGS